MSEGEMTRMFVILLVTFTSCQSQILQIERNSNNLRGFSFSYSEDTFTNPTQPINKEFCKSRNAKCKSMSCSGCVCKNIEETFVSYQQGCLNYPTAYNVLKVSQCTWVPNTAAIKTIPLTKTLYLKNHSSCYYQIILPKDVSDTLGRCRQTGLTFYDIKYGEESTFNQQFFQRFIITKKENYTHYCLKCKRDDCALTDLSGHLLRLSINCTTTFLAETKFIDTCFVFSIEGSYKINTDSSPTAVISKSKTGALNVQRVNRQKKIGDFYIFIDYFTNLDESAEFCAEFGAYCSTSCNTCICHHNDNETFVSYRHGCMKTSKVQNQIIDVKKCTNIRGYTEDIVFIQKEEFKYGTCINLELSSTLPGNQYEWSCVIENTKYINALNGAEEISTQNPFIVKFSTIFRKNHCLQCKSFTCDLSMYSGMMMKLEIKCMNSNSSQIVDTCFAFTLDGHQSYNETINGKITENPHKSGSIEVQRKSEGLGTRDFFTNQEKDKNLCSKSSSICDSPECLRCKCLLDFPTFISYNHGCVNISKENKEFAFQECMHSETTLVKSAGFNRKRCVYLRKPKNFTAGWSCVVESMSYVDPIKGEEIDMAEDIPFKLATSKIHLNKFCLQCDYYNCDVSYLTGILLKLGIKCRLDEMNVRKTCAIIKMEGMYATNATFLTSTSEKGAPKDEGSSSSVIGVVVSVLILLIGIVPFIFIWRRRRNQKKNTNYSNNGFSTSRSNNMELAAAAATEMQLSQEYASVGACVSNQTSAMTTRTIQKEENLYYKVAQRMIDNNPICSGVGVNSPFRDPDSQVFKKDLYTEAENPTLSSEEITTIENVSAEGHIYSEVRNPPTNNENTYVEENIYAVTNDNPIYGTDDDVSV